MEILIANNFIKWSLYFYSGLIKCNNKLVCLFTTNYSMKTNFVIYNAWTKYKKYNFTKRQKIILWSLEKISWKKEMINISMGKNNNYYGGIDYRLFYSPFHFSNSYLGSIPISLKQFIINAYRNIKSIESFMNRKSIVYIQRKSYSKRDKLVKKLMTFVKIDSYGKNLNNKYWPKGKSKIDLIKNYKFCLAIENSIETSQNNKFYYDDIDLDYSTEKLYDCLEGGAIPIYYGPRNSNLFLPNNNSAIVMGNFDRIDELIAYIKSVEYSKKKIAEYISWPITYSKSWYFRFSNEYKFSRCKLCRWAEKYRDY